MKNLTILLATLALTSFVRAGEPAKIAEGFSAPTALAWDKDGALYVSEWGAGRVTRIKNGERETLLTGLASPAGLACDDEGALYIAGYGDGAVYRRTGKGEPRKLASGLKSPTGLLWRDGELLVANRGGCEIVAVYPDGRAEVVSSGHSLPVGAAVADDGRLYVSCYGGSVDIIDQGGGRTKRTDFGTPGVGIVAYGDGVAVVDYGRGEIVSLAKDGKKKVLARGLASPVALGVNPDGSLIVGCWGDGSIYEIKKEN